MKIGLQQPFFNFPGKDNEIGATLIAIAKTAGSSGFSSFWLMDHFYQVGQGFGRYTDRMLEAYVSLGFLAGVTERITLGTQMPSICMLVRLSQDTENGYGYVTITRNVIYRAS